MAALEASLGRELMPRPLWTGSLSFGLVNVPVQLVSAVRDLDLHFRQLHEKDERADRAAPLLLGGGRRGRRARRSATATSSTTASRSCSPTRSSRPPSRARRARSTSRRSSTSTRSTRSTSTTRTSCVPAGESEGTAARLPAAGRGDGAAPSGSRSGASCMRTKEYLVRVRVARRRAGADDDALPRRGAPDRRRSPTGGQEAAPRSSSTRRSRSSRRSSTDWDPERYKDCYRERLRKVIERKRKGGKIEAPEPEKEPAPVPDLMEDAQTLDRGGPPRRRSV